MGKARRKRGLIAIDAIRGTDIEDLVKRYRLSANRIKKAVKSGLEANGLPSETRKALKEGLKELRNNPEQAVERVRRKAGLLHSEFSAKAGKTTKTSEKGGSKGKTEQSGKKKESKPVAKAGSGEAELPTRLKNILLDTDYAPGGEIDRAAVARASMEDLEALPGCGNASAEKILAWAKGE